MKKKNFNIKNIIKITLTIFGVVAIIVPIAYFSTSRVDISSLTAAGSSAVFPLVRAFAEEYSPADITVQAGGSGAGIQSILNGNRDIGMVSKDPISDFIAHGGKNPLGEWSQRGIKTVTIAWDGMALIYRDSSNAAPINLDKSTIELIYKSFAGNSVVTYNDLGIIGNMTPITPFARTGGANASGTADSFFKSTNLLTREEQKKVQADFPQLQNGNYGPLTRQTPESNSQSLQQVLASNNPGSMVYLSAGFTLNNISDIENAGFKIANYKNIPLQKNKITFGYDWFRPLNILFSLNDSIHGLRDFVLWMVSFDFKSPSQEIIENEGFINLTLNQKLTMTLNNSPKSFFESDSTLGYTGAIAEPISLNINNKIIINQQIQNDSYLRKFNRMQKSRELND